MSDSNENKQPESSSQNIPQIAMPQAVIFRFRRPLIILAHIVAFSVSLLLSFLVAHNMVFRVDVLSEQYFPLLVFFLIVKLIVFGFFRQYRGWWRYVGISDLLGILRASIVSTGVIVILWFTIIGKIPRNS